MLTPNPQAICAACPKPFLRLNSMQIVCSVACARRVPVLARKAKAEARKAEVARDRAARERLKRRSELMAEARDDFNAYIRLRDAGKPCICCGKPMEPERHGGSVDAGHYMSVGSCPELRFEEENVHAQRKNCNKPGGTTRASFRAGMIAREGLAVVERLEGPNPPRKYTADDLREIRDEYKSKAKALRAARVEG